MWLTPNGVYTVAVYNVYLTLQHHLCRIIEGNVRAGGACPDSCSTVLRSIYCPDGCSSVVRALAVEVRGQISFVLVSHPEWSNVVEHLVPSLCCYEVNENLQSLEIKLRPLAFSCQCPHISL